MNAQAVCMLTFLNSFYKSNDNCAKCAVFQELLILVQHRPHRCGYLPASMLQKNVIRQRPQRLCSQPTDGNPHRCGQLVAAILLRHYPPTNDPTAHLATTTSTSMWVLSLNHVTETLTVIKRLFLKSLFLEPTKIGEPNGKRRQTNTGAQRNSKAKELTVFERQNISTLESPFQGPKTFRLWNRRFREPKHFDFGIVVLGTQHISTLESSSQGPNHFDFGIIGFRNPKHSDFGIVVLETQNMSTLDSSFQGPETFQLWNRRFRNPQHFDFGIVVQCPKKSRLWNRRFRKPKHFDSGIAAQGPKTFRLWSRCL